MENGASCNDKNSMEWKKVGKFIYDNVALDYQVLNTTCYLYFLYQRAFPLVCQFLSFLSLQFLCFLTEFI